MKLNTKSIVIIDASVENYQQLLNGVIPGVKPFLLGGDTDGIQQIGDILQKHPETDTLHIISHGSPGCLYLGNSQLSLDTLKGYEPQLQQWQLDNLLLYGCNVAAGDGGEEFIDKLHRLTGAEIAASKSLTGAAVKGGNWELEVRTGKSKLSLALQVETMASYSDTLNLQFEWAKQIGASSSGDVSSITTDSNGNVLVGGLFQGNIDIDGDGNNDFTSNGFGDGGDGYVAKFDSNGNLVWAKQIGGSIDDNVNSITTDSSGNVLVAGGFGGNIDIDGDGNNDFSSNNDSSNNDAFAAKLDSNGNLVWAKQIGGSVTTGNYISGIITDSSGNALVAGTFKGNIDIDGDGNNDFTSNNDGSNDSYVAKFDSNGNLVWAKRIGGSNGNSSGAITIDSSDNVLVAGGFKGNIDIDDDGNNNFTSNGEADSYVAKFDSNGNLVWAKQIGGSSLDYANSITTDSSDNVFVGGSFNGNIDIDGDGNNDFTSISDIDGYVAKLDSNGNLVWAKQIGGSSLDYANSITTDSSDNVFVGGSFNGNIDIDGDGNNDFTSNGNGNHTFTAKYDSNGNLVWVKHNLHNAYTITTDSSGNVLMVSDFNGNIDIDGDGDNDFTSNGDRNGLVVKFSDDTNSPPTDIALSNNTIDENVAANTPIGNLSSTDPDTGDTFTYSLVSGAGDTDNGTFNISGDELTIKSSPDYENKPSYSIRVETTDAAGETYQKELTINVNDLFDGNSGNDILRGTAAADSIYGLEGRDKLYGKGGNDIISGGADSDIVKGDSGDDQLNGDDGRDRLYGGTGNDIISGGEDKDIVKGDSGDDQLNGDAGPDRLYGGTGNDILLGGDGNDLLYGQGGDDELNGGPGMDRLYGSDGIDTFVLGEGQERDSIYNFAVGTDKIKLEGSLSFGQLQIFPRGSSSLIEVTATGEELAIVLGVNAADINDGSVFI